METTFIPSGFDRQELIEISTGYHLNTSTTGATTNIDWFEPLPPSTAATSTTPAVDANTAASAVNKKSISPMKSTSTSTDVCIYVFAVCIDCMYVYIFITIFYTFYVLIVIFTYTYVYICAIFSYRIQSQQSKWKVRRNGSPDCKIISNKVNVVVLKILVLRYYIVLCLCNYSICNYIRRYFYATV